MKKISNIVDFVLAFALLALATHIASAYDPSPVFVFPMGFPHFQMNIGRLRRLPIVYSTAKSPEKSQFRTLSLGRILDI